MLKILKENFDNKMNEFNKNSKNENFEFYSRSLKNLKETNYKLLEKITLLEKNNLEVNFCL